MDITPYPPTHWRDHWQQWRHGQFLEQMFLAESASQEDLKKLESLCHKRFGDQLDRVRNADLILFQGEGALGSARAFRRTQLFGLPLLAKRLYGKTVISTNQTISFSSDHQARILQNIYAAFDMNFVREKESLALCQGGGWPEFGFIPDAAFFYRPQAPVTPRNVDDSFFCVTGSAGIRSYDVESYAKNINAISRKWGLRPVFVYSRSSDAVIVDAYKKISGEEVQVVTSKSHPDVDQLLGVLAGAVLVVGGRYHTSISALSLSVPVILTRSNSHKSEGLSRLFNGDVRLVDHADTGQMMAATEAILDDAGGLKDRLKADVQNLFQESNDASDRIKRYLKENGFLESPEKRVRRPSFQLENRWRRLAPLKSLFMPVNLGIFDRSGFSEE